MDIWLYVSFALVLGGWLFLELLFALVFSNMVMYVGEKWSDFFESRRKKDVSIERK